MMGGVTVTIVAAVGAVGLIVVIARSSWLSRECQRLWRRVNQLDRRIEKLEREARGRREAEVDHAAVAAAFAPPVTIFHKLGLVRSNDDDVSR